MSDDDPAESGERFPFDSHDPESDTKAESDTGADSDSDSSDDAPLSDLARRVGRQRERGDAGSEDPTSDLDPGLSEEPPPDSDDDPFEQMSVGEIDEETLWSSLGSDDTAGVGVDVDSTTDPDTGSLGSVEPVSGVESVGDAGSEAPEHVVPKDTYCQSCPYLNEPPRLACTHEGTEIVEVVDNERFRVRNCPMVEGGVEPTE